MSKSGKASRCSSALVDRSKLLPSICGAERADLATKLLDNEQVLSKGKCRYYTWTVCQVLKTTFHICSIFTVCSTLIFE